jgi:hypothetical protein
VLSRRYGVPFLAEIGKGTVLRMRCTGPYGLRPVLSLRVMGNIDTDVPRHGCMS